MNIYKTKEIRKEQSVEKLKFYGIDYLDDLPVTYSADEVKMKSLKEIVGRYIANIICIQVAFDILNDIEVEYSIQFFGDLLNKFGVKEDLNETEKKIFAKELSERELINITWQYEAINALAWVLGLKKNMEFPSNVCDAKSLLEHIAVCESFNEFINKCKIIDIEDVLDELDVMYRYHWAVIDKKINPSTNIGDLNEEIVIERRRALEWLFNKENDWNKLSLNT